MPSVWQAQAHSSHGGRDKEALQEEFDQALPLLHKFLVDGNSVRIAKGADDD